MYEEEGSEIFRILCGRSCLGQATKLIVLANPNQIFFGKLRYLADQNQFALILGSEPLLTFQLHRVKMTNRSGSSVFLEE